MLTPGGWLQPSFEFAALRLPLLNPEKKTGKTASGRLQAEEGESPVDVNLRAEFQ
jgi:hypothetical protein